MFARTVQLTVALSCMALYAAGCDGQKAEKPDENPAAEEKVESHEGHDHDHEGHVHEAETAAKKEAVELVAQKTCPVMAEKIDKKIYVDHEGKRVYFCCAMCKDKFKAEPAKYLKKLEELGEKPETL